MSEAEISAAHRVYCVLYEKKIRIFHEINSLQLNNFFNYNLFVNYFSIKFLNFIKLIFKVSFIVILLMKGIQNKAVYGIAIIKFQFFTLCKILTIHIKKILVNLKDYSFPNGNI